MKTKAWLVDIKVLDNCVEIKFKKGNKRITLKDSFSPYFYILAENTEQASYIISQHPDVEDTVTEKRFVSLESRTKEQVIKISVDSINNFFQVTRDIHKVPGLKEVMERNIPHYFRYMIDRNLGFFREYQITHSNGLLKSATETGRIGTPKLNKSSVRWIGGIKKFEFLTEKSNGLVDSEELKKILKDQEIDVVFSPGHSLPKGDWLHIDVMKDIANDIYSDSYDLNPRNIMKTLIDIGEERLLRIIELSWITGVSPHVAARITPGGLNTYLHMKSARKKNYIIPDYKKPIERPKTLRSLSVLDKGGLIFFPEPGLYDNVAKCDFASMYPNIIVNYNISPETMECKCCKNGIDVPESGWTICNKRKGIIPVGLNPVLLRRLELKKAMKTETNKERKQNLNLRQKALKNILVTCFGYLGFKNFIFSNVECKESVMLFGRHILMRTKEIAEEMGLNVIYGIVDSVFVSGGSNKKYREFADRVTKETGIELEIDALFTRIAFPSARDSSGIANKYFAITAQGELEARGIGIRHSDCSPLVMDFQHKAVRMILTEKYSESIRKAEVLLKYYKTMVSQDKINMESFAIVKRLRKPLEKYISNAPHVVAARFLKNPGISVTYVYSTTGPLPIEIAADIDKERYHEILDNSLDELVRGLQ